MIVAGVMKRNPVFVRPDLSINDVKELMLKEKVGKLPVLDKSNRLVGVVTKKDLLKAAPSEATTLDMFEISYLLSKLKVEKVMSKDVVSVQQDAVVEDAARLMADRDIGCLPVLQDDLLVGIVTKSDLFLAFVDMFAGGVAGVRITFVVADKPGAVVRIAAAVAELGGNILSFITCDSDSAGFKRCTMKVTGVDAEQMRKLLEVADAKIEDIR